MQLFHKSVSKQLKLTFVITPMFKNFSLFFVIFNKVTESHCERSKEPLAALDPQTSVQGRQRPQNSQS